MGNRTAIAGALGVAVSLVGIVAAASAVSGPSRTRRLVFATTIAALCAMGSTVTSTVASFSARAYAAERTILQGLRDSLPAIPAGGTVLLDGMCSHVGPAVVFLMDWDATGALRVLYEVRDVRGDVVLPYTQVTETGITIHHTYPYRQLYVYNHAHRVVLQLTSVTAARRHFERFNSDYTNGCPPFGGESGVPIFDLHSRAGSPADPLRMGCRNSNRTRTPRAPRRPFPYCLADCRPVRLAGPYCREFPTSLARSPPPFLPT